MRKIAFSLGVCIRPDLVNMLLQPAESLFFRDTGIGNTVIMVLEQVPFFLRTQVAVVGNTLIMAMRHQVHDIFFQIGTGTADDGHFILADHFCQTDTQFGGTHGTGQAYQHFTPLQQVGLVSFGGIDQCGSVKVPVMVLNELRNRSFTHHA